MKNVLQKSAETGLNFTPLGLDDIRARFDFTRDPKMSLAREWFRYCQLESICVYEYPTTEYVGALATYLAARADQVREKETDTVRILEVAAGQGLMSLCLARNLHDLNANCEVVAVDDRSWDLIAELPSVANTLDYREAIPAYRPHFIIGAWLPESREVTPGEFKDEDWTKAFRQNADTAEYILIGRTEPPNRHASPEAWGFRYNRQTTLEEKVEVPEYEQDGFERIDMEQWRELQLSSRSYEGQMHQSLTVCFRRQVALDT